MPSTTRRSARRDTAFFGALEKTGSPAAAARAAGYPRSTVYRRRRAEPKFSARWDEALALYVESLELALDRRGFEGTEEPVIYQGKVQYKRDENGELALDKDGDPIALTVRKFDTRAAMFRLQSLRGGSGRGGKSGGSDGEGEGEGDPHIADIFDFEMIRGEAGEAIGMADEDTEDDGAAIDLAGDTAADNDPGRDSEPDSNRDTPDPRHRPLQDAS